MTDAELIAHFGGPTKLAKKLQLTERGSVQRIQNWIKRGIPAAVKVQHPGLFLNPNIRKKAQAPAKAQESACA